MYVLQIGALWCQECVAIKPIWQKVQEENPWIEATYLDYDDDAEVSLEYVENKEHLPLFIFFSEDDEELERLHGIVTEKALLEAVTKHKDQ